MTRETLSLDTGWRFHLGDVPFPKLITHSDCYNAAKAGRATGAAAPGYDDSEWSPVAIPHDWASESPFDPQESVSQGFRPRGIGWYRRHFRLEAADRGRHLELQFDGIATHCTVWVNGSVVHRNWCGYTSFYIDLTALATYGDELNTVAIRVDADAMEGWWYEGAGIYRHAWLVKRHATHLVTDGVFAQPVRRADGSWHLPVEATLENVGRAASTVEVVATIDGVSQTVAAQVPALDRAVVRLDLPVAAPRLWTLNAPVLYPVRTVVREAGVTVDEVTTTCGFRTIRFDAATGFYLNEQPVKLHGVCGHQDHAGVGVAVSDELVEWRLLRLKAMGTNAYRVAHNPPSREFLDHCDRLGILVMDENRHFNSSPEYLRQLEWLIRRDRNHPCVILWSVFNEEPMQGTEVGYEMVRRMAAVVKRLDPTRPVTAAMNGGLFAPINVSQAVDVVGFNYQIEAYDPFHAANPHLPSTSSEDTSAFMTRGEYPGSYDTEYASWGTSHRNAWRAIGERAYLAGGFVWTGFDYHGEPSPKVWPTISSYFGAIDLCGFPKTAFHMHRAHWVRDALVLELVPHWNWPAREGQPIRVIAVTNAARVALVLNGVAIGEQVVDPYEFATWEVPYTPGRLEAIAYDAAHAELGRAAVETTGAPVALRLTQDGPTVTVDALDAAGRHVPTANLPVEFEVRGPGAIVGLGNGDPLCHEPEKGHRRSLFNGLAQVLMEGDGEVVLVARAAGLRDAVLTQSLRRPARPTVPEVELVAALRHWRMSPPSATRPDPHVKLDDHDMNSWTPVQPGAVQALGDAAYAMYRTSFTPFASICRHGGQVVFQGIAGAAEVWVDGAPLATKTDPATAPLIARLPPGAGPRSLTLLVHAPAGLAVGLANPVHLKDL